MARKKSGPPASEEEEKRAQVTLDPDVAKQGRIIAAARGMTLPDLVNNRLRPLFCEELPEVLDELGFQPRH